jgi:hypothetical protein
MGVRLGAGIEQQRGHLDGFRDDGIVEWRPADRSNPRPSSTRVSLGVCRGFLD